MKLTITPDLPLADLTERLRRADMRLTGRVLRDGSHETVCIQTDTPTCEYPECRKRNPSVQIGHKIYCSTHALIVMHEDAAETNP